MKFFVDTLTGFLNFRREYILFSAGVLCIFFLLTAAFFQNPLSSQDTCQFEIETEILSTVPPTCPANTVLRGSLRPQRTVSQLRGNEFFKDIIPPVKIFCPEQVKTFGVIVSAANCFRRFYAKKNPVRAGPPAV